MKEQIENLIQHHKTAKLECQEYMRDLKSLSSDDMSPEETSALTQAVNRAAEESAWRGVFIHQLEDILNPTDKEKLTIKTKLHFDESQDKF